MKHTPTPFLLRSLLAMLMLIVFSSSSAMLASNVPAKLTNDGNTSVAAVIMDAGRHAISAWLYDKAETYFHKGKERQTVLAFSSSVFQKLTREINPTAHVHRDGEAVMEILPWLWLAVRADPHNIQNYLVASFWLAHEAQRPDVAQRLLAEARWHNPFNYPIAMESGVMALHQGKADEAAAKLDAGLAFWHLCQDKTTYDAKNDRARMLLYRALLFEHGNKKDEAITMLEEIMVLFPERTESKQRIEELRSGTAPSLLASSAWSDILSSEISERKDHSGCGYDACAHHEH